MNHNQYSPNKFEICFLYYINPKKEHKKNSNQYSTNKFEFVNLKSVIQKNLKE